MQISRITRLLGLAALPAALAMLPAAASPQAQNPRYGRELNIGPFALTVSPLTPDPSDWVWKINQDLGLSYEQLFAADLTKSVRNGGKYPFSSDAWLPPDSLRGELAESWEMKQNPLRVEVKLRKGVMFPEKPGVMKARELTAEDVVYSYERLNKSPKKIPRYFEHLDKVEATDKYTVVFHMNKYNAEWDYRFGWGYYSAIVPKEVTDAGGRDWKNVNGTGPFMLTNYV